MLGFDVAPQMWIPGTKYASNSCFGYLLRVCLKFTMPKSCGGLTWRPIPPIPRHHVCYQQYFLIPRMGVFEMHNDKNCGTPNVHTSAPNMPATVFLGYPEWVWLNYAMPKKSGLLTWRPKRACLSIAYASNSVSGYLVECV